MMLCKGPTATIAASASLSNAIDVGDGGLVALMLPSGWTTALITFLANDDLINGTYVPVFDGSGTGLVLTVVATAGVASQYIVLNPGTFSGLRYIKIQSGTVGSPVVQSSTVVIKTMVRRLG